MLFESREPDAGGLGFCSCDHLERHFRYKADYSKSDIRSLDHLSSMGYSPYVISSASFPCPVRSYSAPLRSAPLISPLCSGASNAYQHVGPTAKFPFHGHYRCSAHIPPPLDGHTSQQRQSRLSVSLCPPPSALSSTRRPIVHHNAVAGSVFVERRELLLFLPPPQSLSSSTQQPLSHLPLPTCSSRSRDADISRKRCRRFACSRALADFTCCGLPNRFVSGGCGGVGDCGVLEDGGAEE